MERPASSNWLKLQRRLTVTRGKNSGSRKRRKLEHSSSIVFPSVPQSATPLKVNDPEPESSTSQVKKGESMVALRKMIRGQLEYTPLQQQPGKYLALDCEMVGVGIDGTESSLARVSLVNYHGALQLDEFVRQRERVVDYRTQHSGVRPTDMVKAKPFEQVQKQVAQLLKDRILIGHAVFNDLKSLLLSHPSPQTRDTQALAGKHKLLNTRRPALRNLVQQELDVTIQEGEHSSVTDARATMAVYRLHRKEWDKGFPQLDARGVKRKRKNSADGGDSRNKEESTAKLPGGGRKGVSSGLSTVIKRGGEGGRKKVVGVETKVGGEKTKWWKELGSGGSKGSMRLKTR